MDTGAEKVPLSVADFIEWVNASLTKHRARVSGEITKVSRYDFGYFFDLKDKDGKAVMNCFINTYNYRRNGVELKQGMEVIATGMPQVYVARGSFTFQATTLEPVGNGKLQQEYELLKKKLETEGLFANKRPLPRFPHKIGVITSKAGDVIHDFETNIGRYGFELQFVDSRVEGKDAIHELLAAIATLAKRDVDVLVVMKGGGSLESFQAFNTESVVRALAAFPKPVITGIGHEPDITLSQLVADYGASTPSIAAKKLNETWDAGVQQIRELEMGVLSGFKELQARAATALDRASSSVWHQFRSIEKQIVRMKSAVQTATSLMRVRIDRHTTTLEQSGATIARVCEAGVRNTSQKIADAITRILDTEREGIEDIGNEVNTHGETVLRPFAPAMATANTNVARYEREINAYSPERNLSLGYSIAYLDGNLVRSTKQLRVGETVELKVSDGSFTSKVEGIES